MAWRRGSRRRTRCPTTHPTIVFFFFNDTATTEIYTLSLHDALPISAPTRVAPPRTVNGWMTASGSDRKSTRLNSSHGSISYAVFCLKKKNSQQQRILDYQPLTLSEFSNACFGTT